MDCFAYARNDVEGAGIFSVMPGLVPGIHDLLPYLAKDVDGRVKPTAVRFNFGGHGAWH
jgi:hypothetical protein